jgi:hypothetical protein
MAELWNLYRVSRWTHVSNLFFLKLGWSLILDHLAKSMPDYRGADIRSYGLVC